MMKWIQVRTLWSAGWGSAGLGWLLALAIAGAAESEWLVDDATDWKAASAHVQGLVVEQGTVSPAEGQSGTFRSVVHRLANQQTLKHLVIEQTPEWSNWEPVARLGPSNLQDAPVLLVRGPDDYWMFGIYGKLPRKGFMATSATLDGFDVPLLTTPDPKQYDAPGGLMPTLGGYHAWQSRDMKHWVHHGPVTEKFSRWVTTAEQVGGNTYLYYDYPNDQDPHLYIDADLTDGLPGIDHGLAFKDPSHGSDCAMIRDLNGKFHVIYEDWSPINAKNHSWDSPLAGHAVSPDGMGDFKLLPPAVDLRTKATGKTATYLHPHWLQHPEWKSNVAEYQVHEPEQDAFGDWAAIAIGSRYYLAGDYHPAGGKIRLALLTSASIDEPFRLCGSMGSGHPDPDIGFAEGRFHLVTQLKSDFVSPGPWVETVTARIGVDTTGDGAADHWGDWQILAERYDHIAGFSKQIACAPAALDGADLPAGYGFCFELQLEDTTGNPSRPVVDRLRMTFAAP